MRRSGGQASLASTKSTPPMSVMLENESPSNTVIVVQYRLPIIAEKSDGVWSFEFDDDALYLTSEGLRHCLENEKRLVWVGIISTNEDISLEEQPAISDQLWNRFQCVPVYINRETLEDFYGGFCKSVLWPIFHQVNYVGESTSLMSRDKYWLAYRKVNRLFSDTVVWTSQMGDLVWIHDYHLMLVPSRLRNSLFGVKIGFFLHTPWPSSETYRMLPWCEEILQSVLGSSLIGFHLFDYARHFLSACVRLLDLEHKAKNGTLSLEYGGRTITLRVSHIGIHPERFTAHLKDPEVLEKEQELRQRLNLADKCVLGAIDDLDIIKGISLKLLAFERLLERNEDYRKKVKLLQVAIPRVNREQPAVRKEMWTLVNRINERFGSEHNRPVECVERNISFNERVALYRLSHALYLTPIRDGLNLIPYEYIISCQGRDPGLLVLSESTGCSRALALATRVNPFDKREVCRALDGVIRSWEKGRSISHDVDEEERTRQIVDLQYVQGHSTCAWAKSFLEDVSRANEDQRGRGGVGLGLGTTYVLEGVELRRSEDFMDVYARSQRRLFLLDCDGTLVDNSREKGRDNWLNLGPEVLKILADLQHNERNQVCILSGRTKASLSEIFREVPDLGVAAEHGFHFRLPGADSEWGNHRNVAGADMSWIVVAHEVMRSYEERTDGSFIEVQESGLVWHYRDVDPAFGAWQAKEMHEHLTSVLRSYHVEVLSGNGWLKVRLAMMTKGMMVKTFIREIYGSEVHPDFIFCAGDDVTDEAMFEELSLVQDAKKYTCVVGAKPSKADYFVHSPDELIGTLKSMVCNGVRTRNVSPVNITDDPGGSPASATSGLNTFRLSGLNPVGNL